MLLPNPVIYRAQHFTWSNGHGITDASDIGSRAGIPGARIYDDAVDHGFIVKGHYENILFLFVDAIRGHEGDLEGWKYVSECGKFNITIVND